MKMELTFLAIGMAIGSIASWMILLYKHKAAKVVPQDEFDKLGNQINSLIAEKGRVEERASGLDNQRKEVKAVLDAERANFLALNSELATAGAERANLQEKLQNQKAEIDQLQQKFVAEFENLANRILEDKSKRFVEQNRTTIGELLNPLSERLKEFQKKVEDTYDKESKQRFSLEGEIKKLYDLNQQMSKDANNLTNALKGESKTQGNWGEMILESILEKSGLVKGREFIVQETHTTDDGKRQRPDVIINLPENRNMVIDSKVSLTAYERYYSTDDDKQRISCLSEHVSSIRKHIAALSEKKYQNLYQINSPDFVLLFMPIEPAFGLAVHADQNLFYDAFEKNIVIVSPSTLLATLRTIASIWRQENQNRNAMEIARQAGALYDKFVTFVEDLSEIGRKIETTQKAYDSAMNKLYSGSGNLIRRVENIKQLGAKTAKALPQTMIDKTNGDETAAIE